METPTVIYNVNRGSTFFLYFEDDGRMARHQFSVVAKTAWQVLARPEYHHDSHVIARTQTVKFNGEELIAFPSDYQVKVDRGIGRGKGTRARGYGTYGSWRPQR